MAANTDSLSLVSASSQYATPASTSGFNITGNFTIECWVKISTNNCMIFQNYTETGAIAGYYFFINGGGVLSNVIGTNGGSPLFSVSNSSTVVTDGAWHHLAVVYNGTDVRNYFDTVLDNTPVSMSTNPAYNANQNYILGAFDPTGSLSDYYNGLMDELRVWSVARTAAQIAANWKTDVTGQTGLVAYWKFNNDYTDSSGNSHTLTPVNSPTFSTDVPFANYAGGGGNFFPLL